MASIEGGRLALILTLLGVIGSFFAGYIIFLAAASPSPPQLGGAGSAFSVGLCILPLFIPFPHFPMLTTRRVGVTLRRIRASLEMNVTWCYTYRVVSACGLGGTPPEQSVSRWQLFP